MVDTVFEEKKNSLKTNRTTLFTEKILAGFSHYVYNQHNMSNVNNISEKKKILLLNPPGKKLFLRDYYCSSVSKAGYYWPPIDLVVLSGKLAADFDVEILDAMVMGLGYKESEDIIKKISPNIIIFLSSVLSFEEDFKFIRRIKETSNCIVIGTGEVFLEKPEDILNESGFIDGLILDFTHESIRKFIKEPDKFSGILSRSGMDVFTYNVPEHKKFPLRNYRYPFSMYKGFTSVLTTFGCPYKCHFCNSGNIGFKKRAVDDITDELKAISSMGIKEVFFADMTFAADRKHAIDICRKMIDEKIEINWHCYTRADRIDEELVTLMKKSGCYLVQIGVENADQGFMAKYGKDISEIDIKKTFKLLKNNHILTGAHFLFGLPGEDSDSIRSTKKFLRTIKPDYISLNTFSARRTSIMSGYTNNQDKSGLEKQIVKTYIWYYLRPGYILKSLFKIKTFYEFSNLLYIGKELCKNIVLGRV